MPSRIDDSLRLDTIADAIASGTAPHPTGAIRAMGFPRGHHVERRLLKKWAVDRAYLLTLADARLRDRRREEAMLAEYERGYADGAAFGRALCAPPVTRQTVAVTTASPSWLSRLFMWGR